MKLPGKVGVSRLFLLVLALGIIFYPLKSAQNHPAQAQTSNIISLNPATTYQTIEGWEATAWVSQDDPNYLQWRDTMVNQAINDLGITRLRLEKLLQT